MRHAILLLFATCLWGQFPGSNLTGKPTVEIRWLKVDGQRYAVEYLYNSTVASVPAVSGPSSRPHYDAQITVFSVTGKTRKQIGKTMRGVYVPGGCFEDDPALWLDRALIEEIDAKIKQINWYCEQIVKELSK